MNLHDYLTEFKSIAKDCFAKTTVAQDFHAYFKEFFKKENLERAEWEDFQRMGDHINSLNAMVRKSPESAMS